MTVSMGRKINGKTVYMPRALLTDSVPGQQYELQIKTQSIPTDKQRTVAELLAEKLSEKFMAKVNYIEVGDNWVVVQLEGSPFAWVLLLAFIPQILAAVGVIVTVIAVFLIFGAAPMWQILMLLLGVGLVITSSFIGKKVTPPLLETKRKELKGQLEEME